MKKWSEIKLCHSSTKGDVKMENKKIPYLDIIVILLLALKLMIYLMIYDYDPYAYKKQRKTPSA